MLVELNTLGSFKTDPTVYPGRLLVSVPTEALKPRHDSGEEITCADNDRPYVFEVQPTGESCEDNDGVTAWCWSARCGERGERGWYVDLLFHKDQVGEDGPRWALSTTYIQKFNENDDEDDEVGWDYGVTLNDFAPKPIH